MNERRAAVTANVATKIHRFFNKNFSSTKNSFFFSFALKQIKQLKRKVQERSSPSKNSVNQCGLSTGTK